MVYTKEGMVHIGGILRLGEKVAEAAIICGGRWLQSVGYGLVDRIAKGVRRPSEFLLQEMNIKVNAGAGLPLLGMAVMLAGASLLSAPAFGQKLKIKKDATMTLTIPAGTHSSYYRKIKGGGYLLKKGEGILHFVNVKNSLKGTMILEEGALRIEENKELGHNSQKTGLHFTGGTLILASFGTNFILIENREIKIKRKNLGTFFTERSSHFLDLAFTVYVKSKLSGAGELKKTGVDDLNFKEIKAKGFTGTIRMEGGGLVIDGDNDLGGEKGSGLVFSGGTVRFAAPSPIVTVSIVELKSSRLITIEDRGTFDTMGNTVTVVVNSTLAGSGELKKTGSGLLDFRNVQASLFMGTIRLDAGGLLIEKDEDLGARSNSLIFSGGTVRFAAPSPTIAMSIVLGKSRLFTIGIGNTGTFDTMGNTAAVYRSKLVGAGELKKTGQGTLRLYSMQATAFEGTLRIEQGGLQIRNDADLGNKKAKVVLAGGNLILNSSVQTLLADREIFVKGFAGIVGNHTIIDSAIYADDDITLQVSGGVFLRGKQNQIKNLGNYNPKSAKQQQQIHHFFPSVGADPISLSRLPRVFLGDLPAIGLPKNTR